jgi:beta-1,4-mannooligosaccharide/beta-1,4-mannosyl-N-acetylglucosamine phosphorylase
MIQAVGPALPNIPWEDRPPGCSDVVWRYSRNPIITRDAVPGANSIFNSAVVPFNGAFAGVFRCDTTARDMQIHAGFSDDGICWRIEPQRIQFVCDDPEIGQFVYGYDPRVCWIEDRYWVTWCNGYYGPTIGVAYTYDFRTFYQLENAFLPYNRNGVLFPRRINGKYAMLSRPSDRGHTPFGDIFYSESPDMIHWGHHRFVMAPVGGWQSTKVGAGPTPIETPEGWLLIYHGVLTSCNGFVYSFGAALLDLEALEGHLPDPSLSPEPPGVLRVRGGCAQRGLPLRGAGGPADGPHGHLLRRRGHGHLPGVRVSARGGGVCEGPFVVKRET